MLIDIGNLQEKFIRLKKLSRKARFTQHVTFRQTNYISTYISRIRVASLRFFSFTRIDIEIWIAYLILTNFRHTFLYFLYNDMIFFIGYSAPLGKCTEAEAFNGLGIKYYSSLFSIYYKIKCWGRVSVLARHFEGKNRIF